MESGSFFLDPYAYNGSNMLNLGNGGSVFRGSRAMMNLDDSPKRRLFFGSPDDLYDEEYYEEGSSEKKRRLTPEQVHMLEKSFESENKLEPEKKTQLAKKLGLQPRQVAVWFQNRRARWKTKQLERDYDHLKSNYDALRSDFDSIVKENEKLKYELISLTEKVQAKEVIGAPISGEKPESVLLEDVAHVSPVQLGVRVEDRLSSGGGSSAVVDEDGPHLVDSGDSFFPNINYPSLVAPFNGIHSEEDEGSDDGQSYFSNVFATHEQQNQDGEEPLGWWVWS